MKKLLISAGALAVAISQASFAQTLSPSQLSERTIQFGGCDGKISNCLPIMNGWSYTVRLYRARPEILNGKWKFPESQPAS